MKTATFAYAASLAFWYAITLPLPLLAKDAEQPRQPQTSFTNSPAWHETIRLVRDAFPNVPTMTTSELAAGQASPKAGGMLLLDARTPDEFNVSHLEGAIRAGDLPSALHAIAAQPGKSTIVVYCSVGYRSARLASRLRERGIAQVYNLKGSIFQWANEGRALYRGRQRVQQVHPYDEDWGQLLDERYWPE